LEIHFFGEKNVLVSTRVIVYFRKFICKCESIETKFLVFLFFVTWNIVLTGRLYLSGNDADDDDDDDDSNLKPAQRAQLTRKTLMDALGQT
jgi:hypothetical protein